MTPIEAIEVLKKPCLCDYDLSATIESCEVSSCDRRDAARMAIQALEEIQQYRELGTVEHIQLTFELCKGLVAMTKMYEAIGTVEDYWKLNEMCKEYSAIGTIEEFKALKEMTVTQMDIDTFKVYIDDYMDDVAFGNTDWNHSLSLALKCMELHKT